MSLSNFFLIRNYTLSAIYNKYVDSVVFNVCLCIMLLIFLMRFTVLYLLKYDHYHKNKKKLKNDKLFFKYYYVIYPHNILLCILSILLTF